MEGNWEKIPKMTQKKKVEQERKELARDRDMWMDLVMAVKILRVLRDEEEEEVSLT